MVLIGKLKPRIKPQFVRKPVGNVPKKTPHIEIDSSVSNANSSACPITINSNETANGELREKTTSGTLLPVPDDNSHKSGGCETNSKAVIPKINSQPIEENCCPNSSTKLRQTELVSLNRNQNKPSNSGSPNTNGCRISKVGQSLGLNSSLNYINKIEQGAHDELSPHHEFRNSNLQVKKPFELMPFIRGSESESKAPSNSGVNISHNEPKFDRISSVDGSEKLDTSQRGNSSNLFLKTSPKPKLVWKPPRIMKVTPNISRSSRPHVESRGSKSPLEVVRSDSTFRKCDIASPVNVTSKNAEVVDVFVNECGERVVVIDTTCQKTPKSCNSSAFIDESRALSESSDSFFSLNNNEEPTNNDLAGTSTDAAEKTATEDVKMLCAISAIDYLRRHDHALGDSILRRIIVGNTKQLDKTLRPSTCSSCNPRTLRKCLLSLSSYDQDGLQQVLKKSAERQKTAVTFSNFPGKSSFKPSLVKQRAPTLTASTYGKMSYEVKEGLSKKYGTNTPELSKLRMLDLIFYNPSGNPMTSSSVKMENQPEPKGNENVSSSLFEKTSSVTNAESEAPAEESQNASSDTDSTDVGVPRVRIGDEGQIILAPESLVVRSTESDISEVPLHHETGFPNRRKQHIDSHRLAWNFDETLIFYKALHSIGTDFTSMLEVFPSRTRKNLKAKFKREERKNPTLVDKVLKYQGREMKMSDIERDLSMDKTLRRLCVETSRCKKKPDNSLASLIGRNGRKRRSRLSSDDDEDRNVLMNNRTNKKVVWEESIEGKISNKPEPVKLETPSTDGKLTTGALDQCSNIKVEDPIVPTHPCKQKRIKSTPILPKKKRRTKPKGKMKVIHVLNNADSISDEECLNVDTPATPSPRVNCVMIQANICHKEFNCSRSVKLNIDNPDWPVEINETIEHKKTDEVSVDVEHVESPDEDNTSESIFFNPLQDINITIEHK